MQTFDRDEKVKQFSSISSNLFVFPATNAEYQTFTCSITETAGIE